MLPLPHLVQVKAGPLDYDLKPVHYVIVHQSLEIKCSWLVVHKDQVDDSYG